MPVVAIIYGEASGIVRRFVHCDTLRELGGNAKEPGRGLHYGVGESIIILDDDEIMAMTKSGLKPDLAYAVALVAEKRGKPAEEPRCLVIDNASGEIVAVIMADPILDALAAKTLYQHADGDVGYVLNDSGEFTSPIAVAELATGAELKP